MQSFAELSPAQLHVSASSFCTCAQPVDTTVQLGIAAMAHDLGNCNHIYIYCYYWLAHVQGLYRADCLLQTCGKPIKQGNIYAYMPLHWPMGHATPGLGLIMPHIVTNTIVARGGSQGGNCSANMLLPW